MKALYLRNFPGSEKDETLDALRGSFSADRWRDEWRVLSYFSSAMSVAGAAESAACSILVPFPPHTFDSMAVSQRMTFFSNSWGRAFLRQLNRSLKPSGRLWLPYFKDKEAAVNGYWSLEWLRDLFGAPLNALPKVRMAEFARTYEDMGGPDSVLSWFFDWFGEGRGEANASSLNYWLLGLSYKSALVAHIIKTHLPDRDNLHFLDMGGGPGFLSIELLVSDPRVARGVNCEPRSSYAAVSSPARNFFQDRLRGRLSLATKAAETFEYAESFDCISFIGSLLYVPKDMTALALRRAWEHLRPGGVLIVHENIKNPSYKKDYDVMFTVDELDALLSGFGTIHRYLSSATALVGRLAAGEKSVFRVVCKR